MNIHDEENLLKLTATDLDGDELTVSKLDGVTITSWPWSKELQTYGRVYVEEDGTIIFEDEDDDRTGHPAAGATTSAGSFTYTMTDGTDESNQSTCTIYGKAGTIGVSGVDVDQTPGSTQSGRLEFKFENRDTGTWYLRFVSSYGGADSGIESGTGNGRDLTNGFPIEVPVLAEGETYIVDSAASLVDATQYHAVGYWVSDDESETYPDTHANAIYVFGEYTHNTGSVTTPSDIFPNSIRIEKDTPSGTDIQALNADVPGVTWSEGTPDNPLLSIDATTGMLTTTAIASTLGFTTFKAIATVDGAHPEDITVEVYEDSGGDSLAPSIDETVATEAELKTAIEDRIAVGSSDPYCIGLTANIAGTVDLSSDHDASGVGQITVRASGASYTETAAGPECDRTIGGLHFGAARNIRFMLMEIGDTGATETLRYNTSQDCVVDRCNVLGDREASPFSSTPSSAHVIDFDTSARPVLRGCYVAGGNNQLIQQGGNCDDALIEWNVFDISAGDAIRLISGRRIRRWIVQHNAFVMRFANPGGTHKDVGQFKGTVEDCLFQYNWTYYREIGGSYSHNQLQGWFFGGGSEASARNVVFQDFYVGNGPHVNAASHTTVTYCTSWGLKHPSTYSIGALGYNAGTVDYNSCVSRSTAQTQGVGNNGVLIVVDVNGSGHISTAGFATQGTYIKSSDGQLEWDDPAGDVEPDSSSIKMHWDYTPAADRAGCYDLFRLCYDATDKNNWMDRNIGGSSYGLWPIRPGFRVCMDTGYDLASGHGTSTTYDSNGEVT